MSESLEDDLKFLKAWDGESCLCLIRGEKPNRDYGFLTRRAPVIDLGFVWDGGTGEQKEYESFEAESLAAEMNAALAAQGAK